MKLVAENSHSLKPWLYKFAGAWGNHEGSMLLWVTVLAVAGAGVALFERRLRQDTLIATLAAQAAIGLGFYAYILIASNPFDRLFPVPLEGNGLNPLLQDPGLAFHPPTLYFGYVGISIAFSFAVGALVTRDVGPAFARAMRPWVLGAWTFLTLGITAGSSGPITSLAGAAGGSGTRSRMPRSCLGWPPPLCCRGRRCAASSAPRSRRPRSTRC